MNFLLLYGGCDLVVVKFLSQTRSQGSLLNTCTWEDWVGGVLNYIMGLFGE